MAWIFIPAYCCLAIPRQVINYPAVAGIDAVCFPARRASMRRRRLWSCALLAGVILVNVALPNINTAFGLCGSLGLGSLAYVLPGACFLKLGLGRAPGAAHAATAALLGLEDGGDEDELDGAEGAGDDDDGGTAPPPMRPAAAATWKTWALAAGACVVLLVGVALTFGSTARIIYVAATSHAKPPAQESACVA